MSAEDEPPIERRFTLETLVGRGAFGEVYRGRDVATGKAVAIKRLHGHLTEPTIADRFEREARLLARLRSPHVVRYIAHGADSERRPWLVLEWLEGEDLAVRQRTHPLTAAEAVEVVRQAALGLDALHDAGIVHRDVKPSNFFLTSGEGGEQTRVKLIDLGIARAPTEAALTLEGARIGTPSYMSPEQARGEDRVTARSDLFSLGVVLYELLAGRRPFAGADPFAVLAKIVLEDPPRLRALVTGVSHELDAVVMRAMDKSVEARFESARDMADALAAVPRPEGTTPRTGNDAPTAELRSGIPAGSMERRVVTALFAGFAGLQNVDAAMRSFERIVTDHGGVSHRTLGRRLIAVFGAARSSGDEALRAARAALASVAGIPGARLSLSTGRATAGAAGLSGEAIERGAADIEKTRGGVRVDGSSARLLRAEFVIAGDEGDLVLQGERADISSLGPRLLGRQTPLVGREPELETLQDAYLRAARDARAGAALVLGAPGIGKSRLRFELLRRVSASAPPGSVMVIRGDPMLSEVPLGMLARALRHDALVDQGSDIATQRIAVYEWAARMGLQDSVGVLGELLRVHFESARDHDLAAARDDPAVMRARLRETLTAVLSARLGAGPVVIALDDAQWADSATLDAIGWALDALSAERVFVMAFGRPETSRRFPRLWSANEPVEIQLGSLSSRASESLVRGVLGDGASTSTVQSIVSRAAGNPLFIEELLRASRSGDEGELPLAIQVAFQIRLDALAPAAKRVAMVGSVLGTAVWREAITAMVPEIDVAATLGSLVQSEVLAERPRARFGKAREYVYRHSLLRDAAYEMLLPDEVARLHRMAAAWLAEAGEEDDAVLAHHLEKAGEFAEAAERYLAAARRAARESAYELAYSHAERGISLAPAGETLAALHTIALQASHPLGNYASGLMHGEKALAATLEPARRLEIGAAAALTMRRTGQLERGRVLLHETLRATESAAAVPDVVRARISAHLELAWGDVAAGRYAEAIASAEHVLATMPDEVLGLDGHALSASHVQGRAQHGAGELERALETHRALVKRATSLGHRWRSEGARSGLGQVLLALGQNEEARRELELARDNARQFRLPSTEGYALHYLGVAKARLGALDEACACEIRAAQIGEQLNAPALSCASNALLAVFELSRGHLELAMAAAQSASNVEDGPRSWRAVGTAVIACALAEGGDRERGGALANEVVRAIEAEPGGGEGDDFATAVALRALVSAGDPAAAERLRASALLRLEARLACVTSEALRRAIVADVPMYRVLTEKVP